MRIKGSNSDGKWNATERVLDIHIRPPFYLSTWAYAGYTVLALCSLAAVIIYFRKQTRQKHQQAMDKFEREKERELYTAKIDFFTNVAHEIRTPLTLIKSPLENVLVSQSVSDDIRDDLETMELNTNRLLDLVNQLLDFRKTETQGFQLNLWNATCLSSCRRRISASSLWHAKRAGIEHRDSRKLVCFG